MEPKTDIRRLNRTPSFSVNRLGKMRLDRNECTVPFPKKHFNKIWREMDPEEISAYPELEPFYLRLCEWLGVERPQVLLTSGSDTAIRSVYEVYVSGGDEVVMLSPTYAMYPVYCDMFGAVKNEVFFDKDFTLSAQKVIAAINRKTKLVAIANPNNTGTFFTEQDLVRITAAAKDAGVLVLIDEAYYHFHNGTMLSHIREFDNLIIARTFSKAFGLASLRIGYLVSNENIIRDLYKVKLTHEITAVSAKFGKYLLDHPEIMEGYVKSVEGGKKYLMKEFKKMGIFTPASCTNFMFAKPPQNVDPGMIVKLLREKDIYISGPFRETPIEGCVRITVGPLGQMKQFLAAFGEIYAKCKNE